MELRRESPALPTPTSFDYYPPPMNARSILVFELSNDCSDEHLELCLSKAFVHMQHTYPISQLLIAYNSNGQVEYLPSTSKSGDHKVLITKPSLPFPSFAELKDLGAPIDLFQDSLAPASKFPIGRGPHAIFDVKATRFDGGLVLCFSFAHRAIDGGAMAFLMNTFATGCKGAWERLEDENDHFKRIQFAHAHALARGRLRSLELPKDWSTLITEFPLKLSEETETSLPLEPPMHKKTVRLFKISSSNLTALKAIASPPSPNWISTNDALSALIMRCVTRARQPSITDTHIKAHITVNARSKFSPALPDDYMGNCVLHTFSTLPLSTLFQDDDTSLAELSLLLRKALTSLTPSAVETIGGWMNTQDHKQIHNDYAYYGRQCDYGLISWAEWGLYDADFGFGFPMFFRQCATTFSDSCRIFPRGRDGSLEVLVGLLEEDIERLRNDEVWKRWMEEVEKP